MAFFSRVGSCVALALALSTLPAWAASPAGLTLEVTTADAELVRAEVERELALLSPAPQGTLTIHDEGAARVLVIFLSKDGRRLERALDTHAEPRARAEEIALLVANVVSDEASAMPEPAPAPAPAPPAPVAVVAPAKPCSSAAPRWPVGADLLPWVGTSSIPRGRSATRVLSLNVVAGLSGGLEGVEIGSVGNLQTRFVCGLQIAGAANVVTGPVRGMQIAGVVNVATGDVHGVQLGVVNYAARVRGVQLGVLNVAKDSDYSLGLINVIRDGRTHVDAWVAGESGLAAVALKHGGKYWHSIYGVGSKLTVQNGASFDFVALLGLGAHIPTPHQRLYVDLDGLVHLIHRFDDDDQIATLAQLRAVLGVRLLDWLSVYAGPSLSLMLSDGEARPRSPSFAHTIGSAVDSRLETWPGIVTGVSFFTDPTARADKRHQ